MPRIPVRTEPYTSPSRQHRHFKNKRDQVLRALGKAAYINGSHFAIMWVSARGDVETYASEALQGNLEEWFVNRGITEEAKTLVRNCRRPENDKDVSPLAFAGIHDDALDDEDDEEDDEPQQHHLPDDNHNNLPSASNTPTLALNDDVFTDANNPLSLQDQRRPRLQRSASTSVGSHPRPIAPLDTNLANDLYRREIAQKAPRTSIGEDAKHGTMDDMETEYGVVPHSAPLRGPMIRTPLSRSTSHVQQGHSSLIETTFQNMAARTAFLELRFSQLQQGMCKTVSKAWIKIIEPKKQTRCPYNKGEEGKPDWWPEGVRHKEPDHLMKPERHALLLTILRSPRIKVSRLQLATAEVVALMKADKVSLLMDVYRLAREEENIKNSNGNLDAPMTVSVSTLDGWSEAEQCVISSPEYPNSPSADDNEFLNVGQRALRKRAAPLSRSVSASSFRSSKRRASHSLGFNVEMPSEPSNTDASRAVRRAPPTSAWLMHEPAQQGFKRTSLANQNLVNYQQSSTASPSQQPTQAAQTLQQNYGLVTPLTGNAQLMDPSFLTEAKDDEFASDPRFAGYMSAPASHAQLFPHNAPFPHSQNTHFYNLHSARAPPQNQQQEQPAHVDQLFMQQRLDMALPHNQQGNGGALGLQGMGIPWNAASGFHGFAGQDSSDTSNWWNGQTESQPRANLEAPPNAQPADASFDTSFASTIESAGPATPPGTSHGVDPSSKAPQQPSGRSPFVLPQNKAPSQPSTHPPFEAWMYSPHQT